MLICFIRVTGHAVHQHQSSKANVSKSTLPSQGPQAKVHVPKFSKVQQTQLRKAQCHMKRKPRAQGSRERGGSFKWHMWGSKQDVLALKKILLGPPSAVELISKVCRCLNNLLRWAFFTHTSKTMCGCGDKILWPADIRRGLGEGPRFWVSLLRKFLNILAKDMPIHCPGLCQRMRARFVREGTDCVVLISLSFQ